MELRHLSTFQMIVKEGSFLRAAEKLQYAHYLNNHPTSLAETHFPLPQHACSRGALPER